LRPTGKEHGGLTHPDREPAENNADQFIFSKASNILSLSAQLESDNPATTMLAEPAMEIFHSKRI